MIGVFGSLSYVDVHAGEGEGGEEGGVRDVDEALPREGEGRSLGQVLRRGQAETAERGEGIHYVLFGDFCTKTLRSAKLSARCWVNLNLLPKGGTQATSYREICISDF